MVSLSESDCTEPGKHDDADDDDDGSSDSSEQPKTHAPLFTTFQADPNFPDHSAVAEDADRYADAVEVDKALKAQLDLEPEIEEIAEGVEKAAMDKLLEKRKKLESLFDTHNQYALQYAEYPKLAQSMELHLRLMDLCVKHLARIDVRWRELRDEHRLKIEAAAKPKTAKAKSLKKAEELKQKLLVFRVHLLTAGKIFST